MQEKLVTIQGKISAVLGTVLMCKFLIDVLRQAFEYMLDMLADYFLAGLAS